MSDPIDMKSAKKRIDRKKYANLVIMSFDKIALDAKRNIVEKRSEVERKARKQL